MADGFTYIKNKYPFFDRISGYVVSAFDHCRKPDEKIYRILLDRYSLKPEESVFIDDVPENVAAAVSAGMKAVLFKGAEETRKSLTELGI